jgi:hypothetical protein
VGRLYVGLKSAYITPPVQDKQEKKRNSRPRDGIKDILRLLANPLALLRILLLHLADRLLLPCPYSVQVNVGDAGQRAIEAGRGLCSALSGANKLEAEDVGEGDDVVVAGLAGEWRRGVWRGGSGVDGDGIGDVACGEEGALKNVVMGGACDFDAGGLLATTFEHSSRVSSSCN